MWRLISTQRESCVCVRTDAYAADLTDSSWSNGTIERTGGKGNDIYSRGCENALLIKSILGNRRCMNDGALVRGASDLASEKIRAYRVITARNFLQYFTETVALFVPEREFAYGANRAIVSLAINAENIRLLLVISDSTFPSFFLFLWTRKIQKRKSISQCV